MELGTMPTRPALLLRVEDGDGCFGRGEVGANSPPLHKAYLIKDVVTTKLIGMKFLEPRDVQDSLHRDLSVYFLHIGQSRVLEHILAGIDMALWKLSLRAQ